MLRIPTNPPGAGVGLLEWLRKAATAINELIGRVESPQAGDVRYDGGLQYWDGEAWQDVP